MSAANYVPSVSLLQEKMSILSMRKIKLCVGRDEETSVFFSRL